MVTEVLRIHVITAKGLMQSKIYNPYSKQTLL